MEEQQEKTEEEKLKELKETARMRKIAVIVVIGFIVLFIIALAGVKYFVKPQTTEYPKVTYNNFEFTEIADTWYTQWQHENRLISLAMRFNPHEVENVTVLGELNESFRKGEIYVTFDPYSDQDSFKYLALAAAEMSQSLVKAFNKKVIPACTRDHNETCENLTIVTCEDTDKAVIHLVAEEPTQIKLEDNCITLQGKEFEIVRSVDKLLYLWYKIMILTPGMSR
jgi:hypothetical protein